MAEVWLVCEGQTDATVLRSVFTGVLGAEIAIETAGGQSSLGAVAGFLRRQRGGTVACVADRDYRRREAAEAALLDGRPVFMWRRHSIENYLLEPRVVAEALKRLQSSLLRLPHGPPPWTASVPIDEVSLTSALRACAEARSPQEAGRMTIFRLWEDISASAGRVQCRVPDLLSRELPSTPAECRDAVVAEAARIATRAQEAAVSEHLAASAVSDRYERVLDSIRTVDYLATGRFLEEMHGKSLLSEFQRWLGGRCGVQLSVRRLVGELSDALPIVYGADRRLFGADDFCDLADGVRAIAGLPALGRPGDRDAQT